jgi:hypothetical protein
MAQSVQADEIAAQHQALDRRIREEVAKPSGDDLKIAEMKRQKLALKDEINRREHDRRH